MTLGLPAAESAYLGSLVHRLHAIVGEALVGVYPTGSVALHGYRPGRSDLDVMAVVERPPPVAVLHTVVAQLSHDALPCPATGLEFVVYPRWTVASGTLDAGYVLDLNTGAQLPPKASLDPADGPGFWYAIDRSITAQCGVTLSGEPVGELFVPPSFDALLPVVIESVRAHAAGIAEHGDNTVLNACRALRFRAERRWYAKPAAAVWARDQVPDFRDLIDSAMASFTLDRSQRRPPTTDQVAAFLEFVLQRLSDR